MAPIAAASDIVSVAMQTGSEVFRDFYGRGLLIIEVESDKRAASRDWSTALSFSAPASAVPVSSPMPPEKVSVRDWSTAFPFSAPASVVFVSSPMLVLSKYKLIHAKLASGRTVGYQQSGWS